jgi:hypothetical protein
MDGADAREVARDRAGDRGGNAAGPLRRGNGIHTLEGHVTDAGRDSASGVAADLGDMPGRRGDDHSGGAGSSAVHSFLGGVA